MNRTVLRIGAIGVGIVGVSIAVILRQALAPMPPTGPLALVEPQIGTSDALTSGELEITDDCVRIVFPDGTRSLVIWLRGSVAWGGADRSIAVSNPDGSELTLRSGDDVAIGGAGGPAATLDSAGSWVRRPAETCEAPEWFLAVDARIVTRD